MGRRSENRRAARREKLARRWTTNEDAPRVTGSRGVEGRTETEYLEAVRGSLPWQKGNRD
jgi:hypothetical protein